jgi:hypothetical protein
MGNGQPTGRHKEREGVCTSPRERAEERWRPSPHWLTGQNILAPHSQHSSAPRQSVGSVVSPCLAASKKSCRRSTRRRKARRLARLYTRLHVERRIVSSQHRNSSVAPINPRARARLVAHVSFPKTTPSPSTEMRISRQCVLRGAPTPAQLVSLCSVRRSGEAAPGWIGLATCFRGWSGRERLEPVSLN